VDNHSLFASFALSHGTKRLTAQMKTTQYYTKKALRLALLPRSKNVQRLMTANHIALGNARQYELAIAKIEK
jgi:hypothetical protein